jgi:hypothetical protein
MGEGVEQIEDMKELEKVREQAVSVELKSVIAGLLLTLLALII